MFACLSLPRNSLETIVFFLNWSSISCRCKSLHLPYSLKLETEPTTSLALLATPSGLKYRVQQKNSSNHILILQPTTTRPSLPGARLENEEPAITTISKIQDTLELLPYVAEEFKEKKVNKWHEKFAKTRKN